MVLFNERKEIVLISSRAKIIKWLDNNFKFLSGLTASESLERMLQATGYSVEQKFTREMFYLSK